jgi:L-threonylcarbamoyladenylate synthase
VILNVSRAVEILKSGGVVAIPTETVYGLAGCIDDEEAIRKIFATKARPFFDPLIVHVTDAQAARELVTEWPKLAQVLTEKFWPGPLTLVLKKNESVSPLISSGLETVAVRAPAHPVAQMILKSVGVPLAAPSANRFGRTSPTRASHVEQEFSETVGVVDGGPCIVGVESTVLLIEEGVKISILREGMLTGSEIKKFLKDMSIPFTEVAQVEKHKSPGHLKHHYMPEIPLVYLRTQKVFDENLKSEMREIFEKIPATEEGMTLHRPGQVQSFTELKLNQNPVHAARELYHQMRECSQQKTDVILFYEQDFMRDAKTLESWLPLLDRLQKAATIILD